jgi:ATP-binding cassette subfamily F protein 3
MSTLIVQARELSYRYAGAPDPLFTGVDLTLYRGERAALLGDNGSGKTTLLRLLIGELMPDAGAVTLRARPLLLRQEDHLEGHGSVLESLLAGLPEMASLHREIVAAEGAGLPDPLRYAEVIDAFTGLGGFALLQRLEAELSQLGFPDGSLARPAAELSGGERRLLKLVATFLEDAELRIFDEPTNYLDERVTDFLAERLIADSAAVLIVSHDRAFLDRVSTEVLELERGVLTPYRGNYSTYRATREADRRERERRKGRLEREIASLKRVERTYKVWGGRKEKEKSGALDKGYIGARAAKLQRRSILAKERMSQRIDELEEARPWVDRRYHVAFPERPIPSGTCLAVRDLGFRHIGAEAATLDGVSLTLAWGERVALQGGNGSGKSTLLSLLLGECTPDRGEVLWGRGVEIGSLPQLWRPPDAGARPADLFARDEEEGARTMLGALGVGGAAYHRPLASISEGQQRKVRLVRLLIDAPNVLILDEPTTHLDVRSVEMLEDALEGYAGTLLLVSHDRYLREAVTERRLTLVGGTLSEAPPAE